MRQLRYPNEKTIPIQERIRQTPGGDLMLSAIDYLGRLKERGALPGVPKDEHGIFPFSGFTKPRSFPMQRTETFVKNDDDPSTYCFQVVKDSPDVEWRLVKAWRRGASGRIVEEYPCP
jgi:hypothetical protein